MSTSAEVKKWGNSMAMLIPSRFADMRHIEVGSIVDLESLQVLEPRRRRCELAELLDQFKRAHRHGKWDLGEPIGKESW